MPDSRFLVGTFSYLTLKKEEVQNAIPISFYFQKAGDKKITEFACLFFVYIDFEK